MRIVVTGAAGVIGQMVVKALDDADTVHMDCEEQRVAGVLAVGIAAKPLATLDAGRRLVHPLHGGLGDAEVLDRIVADAPDLLIHPAAVVSGEAEADWDLVMAVNIQGTRALNEACCRMAQPPVLIFSSSVAVSSCADNDTITEDTRPAPWSTYGTQQLLGDDPARRAQPRRVALCQRHPARAACRPACGAARITRPAAAPRITRKSAGVHASGLRADTGITRRHLHPDLAGDIHDRGGW